MGNHGQVWRAKADTGFYRGKGNLGGGAVNKSSLEENRSSGVLGSLSLAAGDRSRGLSLAAGEDSLRLLGREEIFLLPAVLGRGA